MIRLVRPAFLAVGAAALFVAGRLTATPDVYLRQQRDKAITDMQQLATELAEAHTELQHAPQWQRIQQKEER